MSGVEATAARVVAAFRARFGATPEAAGFGPGRVNLIGEHTDYNDGLVLPMAIDMGIVAAASVRPGGGACRLLAVDAGEAVELDARAGAARPGSWASYAIGVITLLRERLGHGAAPAVDVAFGGDLPIGAGLASSAALEVAVSMAAGAAMGVDLEPEERAALCRRAEHEFAGVPCGVMDQLASCCARPGCALLIDCRDGGMAPVRLPPAERAAIVVMQSNVRHALAEGEYARIRSACARAAAGLGARSLREVDPGRLAAGLPGLAAELRGPARHVVGEIARTARAAAALQAGDLAEVGRLMNQSHDALRDELGVSCAELDTLVELARAVPGVLGARMTGAGFGGCAVALALPGAVEGLGRAVRDGYRVRHAREAGVFEVRASGPARSLGVKEGA